MINDIIKVLPDSVANQIAAGEVIQRPASVVKELVENSIDAGATKIEIILKDAGRTLVQVVDNGCGMSAMDARMAFERHATSKITAADDLLSLHTMGFRGEALASIAAIAQVDLRTMRKGDSVGTRVTINGSAIESQEPEACAPGSNLMVKNLFFNVPARRKFLKKDSVELSNIIHEFERLALVNHNVEFSISHNGTLLHQLLPGSEKKRICELFGKSLERQLLPVETETSLVRINGFVCLPENARRRGALQYFMVNGRNMRHPYFHKAVMSCYEELIPADMQPNYFLSLTVDPETIDVNIHPQKHEIKFENELAIRQILVAAIKESLGRFNAVPAIDFDSTDVPDIPVFNPDATRSPEIAIDPTFNPFDRPAAEFPASENDESVAWSRPSRLNTQDRATLDNWELLYDNFDRRRSEGLNEISQESADADTGAVQPSAIQTELPQTQAAQPTSLMQLKGRYILSPSKNGLMVVDHYRAHVNVLYNRYISLAETGELTMQRIMFPEILTLSASQSAILTSMGNDLAAAGFDVSYVGDTSWVINGIPSEMEGTDPKLLLTALVESIDEQTADFRSSVGETIALTMARQAAVKPGQILSDGEMDAILSALFRLPAPNYTPDGKLVLSIIPVDDIAKLFA